MSGAYAGRGDPARSLALLWGAQPAPSRGPKPGLSLGAVVAEAIALADAEGLPALSMRRVAERLGVGAMSLYTYVPGKAELLDLMLDRVLGEVPRPEAAGDWRARLEAHARNLWELYQRHPWGLDISGARAVLGPNEVGLFEATLHVVDGLGLSGREMVGAIGMLDSYVRGAAQVAADARYAEQRTGMSDDQWWAAREPILSTYFDASRYPTLTRLDAEGAFAPIPESSLPYNLAHAVATFEFGLQRVLDGIAVYVSAGVERPGSRTP